MYILLKLWIWYMGMSMGMICAWGDFVKRKKCKGIAPALSPHLCPCAQGPGGKCSVQKKLRQHWPLTRSRAVATQVRKSCTSVPYNYDAYKLFRNFVSSRKLITLVRGISASSPRRNMGWRGMRSLYNVWKCFLRCASKWGQVSKMCNTVSGSWHLSHIGCCSCFNR